jgi:hypothetical protein
MTSLFEFATKDYDWITMEWSGGYDEEEFPPALCGEWSCPGDCYICVAAEEAVRRIFLPIYGPLNRDGIPLGYLVVTEDSG